MEQKKAKHANLEQRRGVYFIVGLIVTLSLVLISFEWTSTKGGLEDFEMVRDIDFESEIILLIPRDKPKPKPEIELPKIAEVLDIVDDDIELDDIEFNIEVTHETEYDISFWDVDNVEEIDEDGDFVIVEEMPLFNGGNPAQEFYKYILKNLKYPEIASSNGIYGKVVVKFVVSKTGAVERPEILRSVDPALDNEALRVILSSPKWTPGKQRGKPVNVIYTFPINFVLQ